MVWWKVLKVTVGTKVKLRINYVSIDTGSKQSTTFDIKYRSSWRKVSFHQTLLLDGILTQSMLSIH